jgi:hypothetical protein
MNSRVNNPAISLQATKTMIATEVLLALLALLAFGGALLFSHWCSDEVEANRAWNELLRSQLALPARFDPAMVADLPEPARRFFTFAIQPGAQLRTVVEIQMDGEISLGSKDKPNYQPMHAQQVLAAPFGLVWRLKAGSGLTRISGSDGMWRNRSWTRFWLMRLIPVVRAGGGADHFRSSFGRVVAESAFWAPAFLLPRQGINWAAVDADTARATVSHGRWVQEVDVHVDGTGRPVWVSMPRWTNANAEQVFRVQPFGGEPSDFREVAGYRLPFRVEGGNFFGTPDYFPFYRACVVSIRPRG